MLSAAEEHITRAQPARAPSKLFGQELNAESYAICRSDMMIKGQDPTQHRASATRSADDGHDEQHVRLHARQPAVRGGVEEGRGRGRRRGRGLGYAGRFGAGLPRINDGSLLFLQHMISKMKPVDASGGSRLAIVFNGSPLFTGAAGSGESEIRRWILENDWLEGIVALPDQLFYNTGISTYFWILSPTARPPTHSGKVILLDARELLGQDAQVPRRQAQGDLDRADRRDHPALRTR